MLLMKVMQPSSEDHLLEAQKKRQSHVWVLRFDSEAEQSLFGFLFLDTEG